MHRRDLLKLSMLLLGSMATASVSRALHAGVHASHGTSISPPPPPTASPFSDEQQFAVKLLADMIIPPTDTPGAVEAGVPAFIDTIVADWYTETERSIFLQGFDDLDSYCQTHGNTRFIAASEEVRIAALQDQEAIAREYQPPAAGRMSFFGSPDDQQAPFFTKLKELVVLGYYTSELGATRELIYQPMVHEFDGDYDFARVGRQWSS